MSTLPFDSSVATLVKGPHGQSFRAVAVTSGGNIALDVTGGSLDWDETRAPRVAGTLTCAVPDAQATIDLLDPRAFVRVQCFVGYRLDDGSLNEQMVADLMLRERRVSRPDNEMTLTLRSDECLVIERGEGWYRFGQSTFTATGAGPQIKQWILDALAYGPAASATVIDALPATGPIPGVTVARDYWDSMQEMAQAYGADIYDNGDRIFRITQRKFVAAESNASLTVGVNGTILASEASASRDDWANDVTIIYSWTNEATGVENRLVGRSFVTAGPYLPATAGYHVSVEERSTPTTQLLATAAARTRLTRLLSRARSFSVSAVAMWWLRPGDTVTVQLPTGSQERHIVSSVSFDIESARMTVATRLPDNASTIGE